MTVAGWITLTVLVLVFGHLSFTKKSPDVGLMGGLGILLILGVVDASQAFAGFSNEGILTVAALYVVAAGLRETGAVEMLTNKLFTRPKSLVGAQLRVMAPVAALSGVMNNTPLVVMLLPVISDWARKYKLSPSKLLIPLSFASVLGGMCTLVGTSTNLIVNGLLIDANLGGLKLFEIAWVGVPVAVLGILFILLTSRWLLPNRQPAISQFEDPREYVLEMIVEEGSPLSGKSIEEAGMRHLPGLFLAEVERKGAIIPSVGSEFVVYDLDRLFFIGVVDSVVDLQKIRGLVPATDQVFKLNSPRADRCLIEAVLSPASPFVGKTVRAGRFRTRYDSVVIGVARNGERVRGKIGDIVLKPGDTLLLEAMPSFVALNKNSRDFYLVSQVQDYTLPSHEKAWIALTILGGMIALVAGGVLSMLQAAVLASGAFIVTRCINGDQARRSVDLRIIIAIAAAFGIGQAMRVSGAAGFIASFFTGFAGESAFVGFLIIYATTMIFTELITNNAAAVLMFPIAIESASHLNANPIAFALAVMIASSAGFATPLGYQTHLMVYGTGGYHFKDFLKIGIPMNILVMIVAAIVIPLVWGL